MVLYAGLPVLFALISIIMALTCYRDEPIKFLINRGTDVKYETASLAAINRVYKIGIHQSSIEKYDEIKGSMSTSSKKAIGFGEALCGSRYWRATWFCMISAMFNQACGVNAVNIYSTTLFN